MVDKPLESVFSYVERAYMRLQAGDVLIRCLEDNSLEPIQEMVQGLVQARLRRCVRCWPRWGRANRRCWMTCTRL
jgi:hypothetical protein